MFEAKKIQTNWSQRSSCDVGSLLHAFFHVELPVHSKSCAGHGVWLEESDSEVSSPRKPRHDVGQTARGAGGHPQMTTVGNIVQTSTMLPSGLQNNEGEEDMGFRD